MANLVLLVPVLLLAVMVKEGSSIRCWTCSSELDPMCNDPFLAQRPDAGYRFTLSNCDAHTGATYPYLTSSKSACKKHKQYVNGILSVTRGCTWKRSDDYSNQCPATNSANERTVFCETCEYDGCNGASAISMTIALIAAPLTLMLFK
ncbi:unnamed protein product [Plutella xylostella]|uniref:(diamondback moth) hypothetical protein n=1 Tax=Plutella xylostella TaxID=51655 RepID=A0A8S4E7W1_PLUXY|nr:uncharacterized protein LOC105381232 [Plutella xylostella]CAG9111506.1 unnamed protein product [Plutella xylostella]